MSKPISIIRNRKTKIRLLNSSKGGQHHGKQHIFVQENNILKNNIWDYRFNGPIKSNDANRKTLGLIQNRRKLCCRIPKIVKCTS